MCFGMDWLFHFLIMLIIICGIVGILLIVVPWALSWLGVGISDTVMKVLRIIIGMIVLIFLVYLLWSAWDCFAAGSSTLMPRRS